MLWISAALQTPLSSLLRFVPPARAWQQLDTSLGDRNQQAVMDTRNTREEGEQCMSQDSFLPEPAATEVESIHNTVASEKTQDRALPSGRTIWIDLDNSPHVPFFLPIIKELKARGYEVVLTARDSYQVRELLQFHNLSCRIVGRHWGKNRLLKVFGTCLRGLQLMAIMIRKRPDLAVSHGSRGQLLSSIPLGIPSLLLFDYEFTSNTAFFSPTWVFAPHYIQCPPDRRSSSRHLRYPGLKEDVYVPGFQPDPSVRSALGLDPNDLVVTVRPPASEAHYHNPESDLLFDAVMNFLTENPEVHIILLPRNARQRDALRKQWGEWMAKRKIVIPESVVDGLNLMWFSDLVISGGGTMNREAAALGLPVYSIFRGKIGAVDRYLADQGRLTLLESVEDVWRKIKVVRRQKSDQSLKQCSSMALETIVDQIASIAETKVPSARAIPQ
jgi:predicted glycosyltransferase